MSLWESRWTVRGNVGIKIVGIGDKSRTSQAKYKTRGRRSPKHPAAIRGIWAGAGSSVVEPAPV